MPKDKKKFKKYKQGRKPNMKENKEDYIEKNGEEKSPYPKLKWE